MKMKAPAVQPKPPTIPADTLRATTGAQTTFPGPCWRIWATSQSFTADTLRISQAYRARSLARVAPRQDDTLRPVSHRGELTALLRTARQLAKLCQQGAGSWRRPATATPPSRSWLQPARCTPRP